MHFSQNMIHIAAVVNMFCVYDSVYASQVNKCIVKAKYLIPFYSLVYNYVASFVDSSDLKFTGKIYIFYMPTYLDEVAELGGACLATKLRCVSGKILSKLPLSGLHAVSIL
jgi:hypothetical protein